MREDVAYCYYAAFPTAQASIGKLKYSIVVFNGSNILGAMAMGIGPQQVIDNSRKELKIRSNFKLSVINLGVK